jgi:hypothetical protein
VKTVAEEENTIEREKSMRVTAVARFNNRADVNGLKMGLKP